MKSPCSKPLTAREGVQGSIIEVLPISDLVTAHIETNGELSPLVAYLRCLECRSPLDLATLIAPGAYPDLGPDGVLRCRCCGEAYPIIAGSPRLLPRTLRGKLRLDYPAAKAALAGQPMAVSSKPRQANVKLATAESFAFEWDRFGTRRQEWRRNFLDYLRPHGPSFFHGRLVLDIGAGSGRHSAEAADLGAEVVALDLGRAIDVARKNLPSRVLTVQADAEQLPFDHAQFDLVMCLGVLHHLPDTEQAFQGIVPYVRPGGHIHVYLYWQPDRPAHRKMLTLVAGLRRLTTRMPHRLLYVLSYPLAGALFAAFVLPYRVIRRSSRLRGLADAFPLKLYADYPFAVCVNDQFDRFSAPLERRFTRHEVHGLLRSAGLEDVQILPNHGWVGDGRRPEE